MTPWTEIVTIVALGAGANTENLPVGLAYGLRRLRIGLARNLLIAAVTTAATLAPLALGRGLRGYVPTAAPDVFAGSLLIALGLLNMWQERRRYPAQLGPPDHRERNTGFIRLHETLALAGALSINNIGLGFAGGIAGLGYGWVALSVAGFSVVLLWLGERLSGTLAQRMNKRVGRPWLHGNLILVAVGALMMIGV